MPRILAIDYGTKRIGLAVTDTNQLIATALGTVHPKDVMTYLMDYLSHEQVICFVVGLPKQMNNSPSEITPHVEGFVRTLKKNFPGIPVERVDERFTSKIAIEALRASGLKKKDRQRKELVDQASAVILLQSFMASQKNI